ncbi:hypothetical protein LCGC14_0337300 [marine sediment metagenome]|uniref:Large polyvalent protein associated domain-containing protein n=1 Tax=marine sediment metagenome TaxID=412755 RepID=A0A0F9WM82_9ZZZZ
MADKPLATPATPVTPAAESQDERTKRKQALYKYLQGRKIKDLPSEYEQFDAAIKNPATAKNIHDYIKRTGQVQGLPQDFDKFQFDIGNVESFAQSAPAPVSMEEVEMETVKETPYIPGYHIGKSLWNAFYYQLPANAATTLAATYSALAGVAPVAGAKGGMVRPGSLGLRITLDPKERAGYEKAAKDAAGDLVTWAQEKNEEGAEFTADLTNSLNKIEDPLDFLNWVGYAIGQAAGQIPAAVATGGISALVLETGEIYMSSLQKLAEEESAKTGEEITAADIIEQGKDDPAVSFAFGTAAAALEYVGAGAVMGNFTKEGIKRAYRARGMMILRSARAESVTEAAQSVLEQIGAGLGADRSLVQAVKEVDYHDIIESAGQGMFGGGGITSVGQSRGLARDVIINKVEQQKEAQGATFEKMAPTEELKVSPKSKETLEAQAAEVTGALKEEVKLPEKPVETVEEQIKAEEEQKQPPEKEKEPPPTKEPAKEKVTEKPVKEAVDTYKVKERSDEGLQEKKEILENSIDRISKDKRFKNEESRQRGIAVFQKELDAVNEEIAERKKPEKPAAKEEPKEKVAPTPPKEQVKEEKPKDKPAPAPMVGNAIIIEDAKYVLQGEQKNGKYLISGRRGQSPILETYEDEAAYNKRVAVLQEKATVEQKEEVQAVAEIKEEVTEIKEEIAEVKEEVSVPEPIISVDLSQQLSRATSLSQETTESIKKAKNLLSIAEKKGNKKNIAALEQSIKSFESIREDARKLSRETKQKIAEAKEKPAKEVPKKKVEPPPATKKEEPTKETEVQKQTRQRAEKTQKAIKEMNPRVEKAVEADKKFKALLTTYVANLDKIERGGEASMRFITALKSAIIGANLNYEMDSADVIEYGKTLNPEQNAESIQENQGIPTKEGVFSEKGEDIGGEDTQRQRQARRKDSESTRRKLSEKEKKAEQQQKLESEADGIIEAAIQLNKDGDMSFESFQEVTTAFNKQSAKKRGEAEGGKLYANPFVKWLRFRHLNDPINKLGWSKMWAYTEEIIAKKAMNGIVHRQKAVREVVKTMAGFFGGMTRTKSLSHYLHNLIGGINWAPKLAAQLQENIYKIIDHDSSALLRIYSLLDRSVVLKAMPEEYHEKLPATTEDLAAAEKVVYQTIRTINDVIHEWHYRNGFISKKTYDENKGTYIARMYEEKEFKETTEFWDKVFEFGTWSAGGIKVKADYLTQRKDLEKIAEESILDPVYLTVKRLAQMQHNQAVIDYANSIYEDSTVPMVEERIRRDDDANVVKEDGKVVVDIHERRNGKWRVVESMPEGYEKLASATFKGKFGKLTNAYVPMNIYEDFMGYQYSTQLMRFTAKLFDLYDRTSMRQATKKLHTIYAPLVQMGNFGANFSFGYWNGINPFRMVLRSKQAKQEIKNMGHSYEVLIKGGVLNANIMTADLRDVTATRTRLERMEAEKTRTINEKAANWTKEVFKFLKSPITGEESKIDEAAAQTYTAGDNIPKMSAFLVMTQDYGMSDQEALQRMRESFQNYATVGKYYSLAAKTPVFGNPYIRFQPDLARIIKNAITKRPLTTIAWAYSIRGVQLLMSMLSGESDEERKLREARSWIPRIPGTRWLPGLGLDYDIPLTFLLPYKKTEINVARYVSPLYIYDKGQSSNWLVELSKFFPYQLRETDGGVGRPMGWFPFMLGDTLLGVWAQMIVDRDFRNKSIADPKYHIWERKSPLRKHEKLFNTFNYGFRSQIPLYKTADDLYRAMTGRLDYYGRERDILQALVNQVVKAHQFDENQARSMIEKEFTYLIKNVEAQEKHFATIKSRADENAKEIDMRDNISSKRKARMIDREYNKMISRWDEHSKDYEQSITDINNFAKKFNVQY